MLPVFPDFEKLSLSHKSDVESYLQKYPPYSDFNFLSMWSYNTEKDTIISSLNDNLVVRFRDYITNEPFYSFLGSNKVEETITSLLTKSVEEKLQPELKMVPESSLIPIHMLQSSFFITEDQNNFDYILSIPEIAALTGDRYHTQRNFVNRFQKLHGNCTIQELDLMNPLIEGEILSVFYRWEEIKSSSREDTEHELTAIKRTLGDAKYFKLISVGIYNGKKLIGFIIADLNHDNNAESHFAKADTSFAGIYYTLYHYLAKYLHAQGYLYLNNEQDLGIPGLRKSKEQWNPIRYLKKYRITAKN